VFRDRPDWLLVNALVRARTCELLAPPRAGREVGGFFFAGRRRAQRVRRRCG
jgi:hypothetical protein